MFRLVTYRYRFTLANIPLHVFGSEGIQTPIINPFVINNSVTLCTTSFVSKPQVTYKPYVQPCYKDHDYKNMTLKRPMSPHLTIYAPTLTATTSIFQRITGGVVTFYALLMAGGSLFLSNGVETYVSIIQSLDMSRPTLFVIKILIGVPFTYHYFNGIRFCLWNAGKLLDLKLVYDSAYKAAIASVVTALLFAIL